MTSRGTCNETMDDAINDNTKPWEWMYWVAPMTVFKRII